MVTDVESPPAKITKTEAEEDNAPIFLKRSKVKQVLSNDISHKLTSLLLEDSEGRQGVILLTKTSFPENVDVLGQIAASAELKMITKNDIFGSYDVNIPVELNALHAQLIYPANEKIIAKYRFEEKFIIQETSDDYKSITLPWIESNQLNLKLMGLQRSDKEAEQDKLIFEDADPVNGFLLTNDIKWDGKNIETLYVQAIINRRNVKSVRDLTADNLPLLENIREKGLKAIKEKYALGPAQVRAYFHYQPSFYHLHVHFVNLKYDAPASSTLSAILLDDVINNLRLMPDYYQKATLNFTRKKSDRLLQLFRDAGRCEQ